jgi:hypothetical protein
MLVPSCLSSEYHRVSRSISIFEYHVAKTPNCFHTLRILVSSYACIPLVNVESQHCQRIHERTAFFSPMLLTDNVKPEIHHFEILTILVSFYLSNCLSFLSMACQQVPSYVAVEACRNSNHFLIATLCLDEMPG